MAKILLAEDDPQVVETVSLTLANRGHEIIHVRDGEEVLDRAMEEHPDLILLDMKMPALGSFEVRRRLKADRLLQSIPVIMLTAKGGEHEMPDPKELAARVEEVLSDRSKLATFSWSTDSLTAASEPRWKRYWKEFWVIAAGCFGWLALSVALGQWPATTAWVTSTPWLLTYVALVIVTAVMAYRTLLHANGVELGVSPSVSVHPTGVPLAEDQPRSQSGPVQVQVDFGRGPIDLEAVERALIMKALARAEWDRNRAARLLGLSKKTLHERIEKYRLATGIEE